MTVGIIPEDHPLLPPGSVLRPFATLLLASGIGVTAWFQGSFLREGAALGVGGIAVLGFSYVPYVAVLSLVWRRGKARSRAVRGVVLLLATLLPLSSWLALSQAFLVNRGLASGLVFVVVPTAQLVGWMAIVLFTRGTALPWRRSAVSAASLALLVAACAETPRVASSPVEGVIVASVLSTDGAVELGVTSSELYFRLTDEARSRVETELAEETEQEDGLARALAGAVSMGVSKALSQRLVYDVADVRSMTFEDGRLRIVLDAGEANLEGFRVNGRDVSEAFSAEAIDEISTALAALGARR